MAQCSITNRRNGHHCNKGETPMARLHCCSSSIKSTSKAAHGEGTPYISHFLISSFSQPQAPTNITNDTSPSPTHIEYEASNHFHPSSNIFNLGERSHQMPAEQRSIRLLVMLLIRRSKSNLHLPRMRNGRASLS